MKSTLLGAALICAMAIPAQAGTFLATNGLRVELANSAPQLEVFPSIHRRHVPNLYCAAADVARKQLGADTVDRVRIVSMPRGGRGAIFAVVDRDAPGGGVPKGVQLLSRSGSSQTVASALNGCRY